MRPSCCLLSLPYRAMGREKIKQVLGILHCLSISQGVAPMYEAVVSRAHNVPNCSVGAGDLLSSACMTTLNRCLGITQVKEHVCCHHNFCPQCYVCTAGDVRAPDTPHTVHMYTTASQPAAPTEHRSIIDTKRYIHTYQYRIPSHVESIP